MEEGWVGMGELTLDEASLRGGGLVLPVIVPSTLGSVLETVPLDWVSFDFWCLLLVLICQTSAVVSHHTQF